MPTSLPLFADPAPHVGGRPRRWLFALVIVQLVVCWLLSSGYWANIGFDKTDHYSLFNFYQHYPFYAVLGISTIVAGIFVTAAAGVAMLKRKAWAPFLYVGWLVVALPSNLIHPHNLDMLRFPFAAFPVAIAIYYVWVAYTDAAETAPPRTRARVAAEAASRGSPSSRRALGVALASFAHPSLFPLAAATLFHGLMSDDRRGLAIMAISAGSLTISAFGFYNAVEVAAAA